jgi:hypothetical protein
MSFGQLLYRILGATNCFIEVLVFITVIYKFYFEKDLIDMMKVILQYVFYASDTIFVIAIVYITLVDWISNKYWIFYILISVLEYLIYVSCKVVCKHYDLMMFVQDFVLLGSREGICVICQGDFSVAQLLSITGCNHCFHMSCLKKYRIEKNICPLCRHDLK